MRESGPKPAGEVARNKLPGPRLLVITVIALLVLVCINYDWWPSRFGDMQWVDPLLFGGVAVLVLAVAGLVWSIRTLYVVGQDRRWSWWILPVPLAVVGVLAIDFLLPPPTFDEMRPQFEQTAHDLLASPELSRANLEIGPFDILYASKGDNGTVYFVDAPYFASSTSIGWAYSPNGKPAGFDDFSSTHIGGPWYKFTAVWRT
ncbi:DUF1109 family protein [Rhodococcus tukisamuensis]|uniref:DUF1109 family protein n=1 Tax=Rhodococcus tukisamuensis TaxID=168276 RepID=UPI0009324BD5|nr:DUF1109 family protein [Rhodococcus tukisamuensis]